MKQPALGIVSSVLVIILSLAFISIFSVPAFTTWVAYALICIIPMVIVIGVTWAGKHPAFAAARPQPGRGILLTLLALATGAVVALVHFVTVGGRVSPPAPMLSMCIITTVTITFWFAIIWRGWPFTAIKKKPVVSGLCLLAASYVVNYLLFRLFFNFRFMQNAPEYVPALDPHGLFSAWDVVVAQVTTISAMFLMLSFELWPLSKQPALMRQPLLGTIWTAMVLGIGAVALYVGKGLLGMDGPVFMVRAPIPFIFGTIIVLNMMQDSLFTGLSQPLKGLLNAVSAAVIGAGLARLFTALAPLVSGHMASGPPGYVFQIWLASALLAVTFLFLIIFADLFQFWPLRRARRGKPVRADRA